MAYQKNRFTLIIALITVVFLVIGIIFVSIFAFLDEKHRRMELLLQAKLVEKAIDCRQVLDFSASEADLNLPSYNRLKDQLISIRSVNPKCRFIYLMGIHPDGKVFFFVDSEPPDSSGYSPPGQIYDEVAENVRDLFFTGKQVSLGPTYDRWGVWINALVPVSDSSTGKVIAVFGMDIDVRDWKKTTLSHIFLPLNFFIMFYGVVVFFLYMQWRNEKEKFRLAESRVALQESENRYHDIFLNFPDAILILRPVVWKFYSGNPAMFKMFGIKDEEQLLSLSPDDLFPERQSDKSFSSAKAREAIEMVMHQNVVSLEWIHKRLNGEEFPSLVLLSKIELSGEIMIQVIIKDNTERKKIEEENIKRTKELEIFYKVSMGREERIIELKKEVERLKKKTEK
ncbi:MAG: PAS domain S-box protein [Candidatus Omnitrophica bacterium]|nr:PAS domain S-box protein [Candidatus Omnitrophota bacterium]